MGSSNSVNHDREGKTQCQICFSKKNNYNILSNESDIDSDTESSTDTDTSSTDTDSDTDTTDTTDTDSDTETEDTDSDHTSSSISNATVLTKSTVSGSPTISVLSNESDFYKKKEIINNESLLDEEKIDFVTSNIKNESESKNNNNNNLNTQKKVSFAPDVNINNKTTKYSLNRSLSPYPQKFIRV